MKKIFFSLIMLSANFFFSNAQQFSGSSTTTGEINRAGNIYINNEGSGVIVDADGAQRVGFMKYQGKYAGIWRNPNSWFEIGRVTGTITSPTGFTTEIYINESGNVGIGTSSPGTFKLAVEGKIGAREVRVTLQNPWPDYVFNNNYNLLPLSRLEMFIKKNKHLPEMPGADQVAKNGIELGNMASKLLEKVEELTLYTIELNKEIEKMKEEIKALRKEK